MRSFVFGREIRAVVLVVGLSATLVPSAVGAPVYRDAVAARQTSAAADEAAASWTETVARIVRVVKKKLGGVTSNADSLTVPRP